jgi:hypothetical protein
MYKILNIMMNGIIYNQNLQQYKSLHKTNGWEKFIQYEIIFYVSNPCKNSLVTNVNDVEKYDLGFQKHV